MKLSGTLIVVKDINKSRKFYEELFGAKVVEDYGENISFDIGLSLQELELWKEFIDGKPVVFQNHGMELYFDAKDFDAFVESLQDFNVKYVHPVKTFNWGQRSVRIYDPDMHIIEIGEDMGDVCRRFIDAGMSVDEVCEKTMLDKKFVEAVREDRQ